MREGGRRGRLQGRGVGDRTTSGHLTWACLLIDQLEGHGDNPVREGAGGSGGGDKSRESSTSRQSDDCNSKRSNLRVALKKK